MGGSGRFNCYVRGCKASATRRLQCITRHSGHGNILNVQCPHGYAVTGCGQNELRRQWNKLSGFEEMRLHGNGCVCDSGFGSGRNQCYARCCKQQVKSAGAGAWERVAKERAAARAAKARAAERGSKERRSKARERRDKAIARERTQKKRRESAHKARVRAEREAKRAAERRTKEIHAKRVAHERRQKQIHERNTKSANERRRSSSGRWRDSSLQCRTRVVSSNRAGVIRAPQWGGYQMVGGGINNKYRHFNHLSAFEESYPEGSNWRCDTGFGPGRLDCYSRQCRLPGMSCITRSAYKHGSGTAVAMLPAGYVATGGGVYNHYRHWNLHAAFETSIPHGNRGWLCDMGLGSGRFNCYVRGCKASATRRLQCITRHSGHGNILNVQCPHGYAVTGCGQNELRRQWNKLY